MLWNDKCIFTFSYCFTLFAIIFLKVWCILLKVQITAGEISGTNRKQKNNEKVANKRRSTGSTVIKTKYLGYFPQVLGVTRSRRKKQQNWLRTQWPERRKTNGARKGSPELVIKYARATSVVISISCFGWIKISY